MNAAGLWAMAVCCFLPASTHAGLQFVRVANTSTPAPGGTGTFKSFDPPSCNREALPYDPIEISFRGVTSAGVKGVYSGFGDPPNVGISRVVDSTLAMPGFAENYGDFVSVSGGASRYQTYWTAVGAGGTNMGVFTFSGTINDGPGGFAVATSGSTFSTFGPVSFGNYDGAFRFVYQGNPASGGNPRILNAFGTLIGNGISPSLARLGSNVVVAYRDPTSTTVSEYVLPAGGTASTRTVADLNTLIPGGSGQFTGFGDATAELSYVLFRGMGTNQQGIYRSTTAGLLSRVADLTTIAPDGSGAHFTSFSDPSPGDEFSEYDAFVATLDDGREGIYLAKGSSLAKLIDTGDPLDGRTIDHLFLGRDAIEDHNIGFKATFTDGSQGIYAVVAPFPEPSLGVTTLSALAWLACRRVRRRRR